MNNNLPIPLGVLLAADGDPVLLPPLRSIACGATDVEIAEFLYMNSHLIPVQLTERLTFSPNARFETVEVA